MGDGMIDRLASHITRGISVRGSHRWGALLFLGAIFFLVAPSSANSTMLQHRHAKALKHAGKPRGLIPFYRAALLEDADTGKVLFEQNADMQWPPASMAKMMLLLVTTEQIKAGRISMDDPVRVSERSAHTGGSRIGLVEGQIYPLGELMKAALIQRGLLAPRTHDLVTLNELLVQACPGWSCPLPDLRALTMGAVHFRYPGVAATEPDAREALSICRRLRTALLGLLTPSP